MKKIFKEVLEYGDSGEVVGEERVMEDTMYNRLAFLDGSWLATGEYEVVEIEGATEEDIKKAVDTALDDDIMSIEEHRFVTKQSDRLCGNIYGDWDDPNSSEIMVVSLEDELGKLWSDFNKKRRELFKNFGFDAKDIAETVSTKEEV